MCGAAVSYYLANNYEIKQINQTDIIKHFSKSNHHLHLQHYFPKWTITWTWNRCCYIVSLIWVSSLVVNFSRIFLVYIYIKAAVNTGYGRVIWKLFWNPADTQIKIGMFKGKEGQWHVTCNYAVNRINQNCQPISMIFARP